MRTEEDKIMKAPLVVVLGGQEYEVKPLVIVEAREWRKKLAALFGKITKNAGVDSNTPEQFEDALNSIMMTVPDEMIDLFFAYAKDLNREEIEQVATESEIQVALMQVMDIALPLIKGIAGLTGHLE